MIEDAGVTKATLYKQFRSKDDLVLRFLEVPEQRWKLQRVQAESRRRGTTADERLLAIFDLVDVWFHAPEFEACPFINALLEMGSGTPWGKRAFGIWRISARSCAA